jgi:hypothetical protein
LMREVIRLVLHLPLDHRDLAGTVDRALKLYLRAVGTGAEILSEGHDLETDPFPLEEAHWEYVHAVLAPPKGGERFVEDFGAEELHRSVKRGFERAIVLTAQDGGLSGYGFFYWARLPWRHRIRGQDEVSLVSFSWPTEYLEERGLEHMRGLLVELASLFPFSSGHAGLAFHSPDTFCASMRGIQEEAFRYPGLDVAHGQRSLGAHVDGVHWLNFLGEPLWAQLGGAIGLSARLHSPDTSVQELPGGRGVVSLGQWPEAGDVKQGRALPAYRELARVLEPWLLNCPDEYAFEGVSHGETQRWWRRFLDCGGPEMA